MTVANEAALNDLGAKGDATEWGNDANLELHTAGLEWRQYG